MRANRVTRVKKIGRTSPSTWRAGPRTRRLRQIDGRIRFLTKSIEAAEVVDPEARTIRPTPFPDFCLLALGCSPVARCWYGQWPSHGQCIMKERPASEGGSWLLGAASAALCGASLRYGG